MKVLMLGRFGLMQEGGGDKIQLENTAKELRKLGVSVDISTKLSFDPKPYDVIHIFQLDWTPESYLYAQKVKRFNKPLVLSPIHHSIRQVKKFDDKYAFDFRRISKLLFKDQHQRDTFKNVYRACFSPAKVVPTLYSIILGLKKMHTCTLELSDVVLVQTVAEAEDLKNTYGVDFRWAKVPNGVSDAFINVRTLSNPLSFENYILCVGRVEPRKNQLKIIKAVKRFRQRCTNLQLVFVGKKSMNHPEYLWKFNRELGENPWIKYVPTVPYDKMPAYYKFAKVCVSASWFETTGLTSLESLFCGANAVASGDRAKEYLGNLASYCEPDNVESIECAIETEFFKPRPQIPEEYRQAYTWENAAKKTLEVYKSLTRL